MHLSKAVQIKQYIYRVDLYTYIYIYIKSKVKVQVCCGRTGAELRVLTAEEKKLFLSLLVLDQMFL